MLTAGDKIELLTEAIRSWGRVRVEATGHCMRPWIFAGDTIEVAQLDGPPRRGMILLTQDGTRSYAHRVIDVAPDGSVRTRGDLLARPDPWRRPDQLVGQVIAVESRWGLRLPLGHPRLCQLGRLAAPGLRLCRAVWHRLRRRVRAA
jgi:hypothetical protein